MLTEKEIRHTAKLAKVQLTGEEVVKFQSQLTEILEYFKILTEVPTDNIPPTFQVTGINTVFRIETTQPYNRLSPEKALRNASEKENQYFVVPPVLQGK